MPQSLARIRALSRFQKKSGSGHRAVVVRRSSAVRRDKDAVVAGTGELTGQFQVNCLANAYRSKKHFRPVTQVTARRVGIASDRTKVIFFSATLDPELSTKVSLCRLIQENASHRAPALKVVPHFVFTDANED